jgi:hypothetical protein
MATSTDPLSRFASADSAAVQLAAVVDMTKEKSLVRHSRTADVERGFALLGARLSSPESVERLSAAIAFVRISALVKSATDKATKLLANTFRGSLRRKSAVSRLLKTEPAWSPPPERGNTIGRQVSSLGLSQMKCRETRSGTKPRRGWSRTFRRFVKPWNSRCGSSEMRGRDRETR